MLASVVDELKKGTISKSVLISYMFHNKVWLQSDGQTCKTNSKNDSKWNI